MLHAMLFDAKEKDPAAASASPRILCDTSMQSGLDIMNSRPIT